MDVDPTLIVRTLGADVASNIEADIIPSGLNEGALQLSPNEAPRFVGRFVWCFE